MWRFNVIMDFSSSCDNDKQDIMARPRMADVPGGLSNAHLISKDRSPESTESTLSRPSSHLTSSHEITKMGDHLLPTQPTTSALFE